MKRSKSTVMILLAVCALVAQAPMQAASHSSHGGGILKPLVPEEDLSVVPDPAEVFDNAVKEYAAGHMPKAEKLFTQVVQLDPGNADAHFNLGAIKEWKNDLGAALSEYRAAAAIKPRDKEIAEAVSAVEYKIRNKPALDAQAAKAKREQDLNTQGQLAKQAFSSQNYVEAITHLTKLAHEIPDDSKIQFALGQSLRALKYYDWAAYRLKMAIFLDPENDLYRTALVELDREIQGAQNQAFAESAQMAISKMKPLAFPDLANVGLGTHEL